jgi:hypothetical protein
VNGALNWSNGFMPAAFQGVPFRSSGEPIAYLTPPKNVSRVQQRARLDLLKQWNGEFAAAHPTESQLAARINSYELAFRMQMSASECTDLSREPESVRKMYGLDNAVTAHFGRNCLLARRLVERGVRARKRGMRTTTSKRTTTSTARRRMALSLPYSTI